MINFFDTNVVVYAFGKDARREIAQDVMANGGFISAQVLNEFTHVSRRKYNRSWPEIESAVATMRGHFDDILPLTAATHVAALEIARDYGFGFYDALIVAAAARAGCTRLYSEDMQNGREIGGLRIVNPFA